MKQYRHDIKGRGRYLLIILGSAFFALFLGIFLLKTAYISRFAMATLEPLLFFKSGFLNRLNNYAAGFKEKTALQKENGDLKNKILEIESQLWRLEFLQNENAEFKDILSYNEKKSYISGSILLRPGYGGYDSLLIDVGSGDGVKEGMVVTAFGNIFLGFVSEVSAAGSRVKLVSFPDTETDVFISNKVAAIAKGLGGENLEILLPQGVEIQPGDNVTTLGSEPLLLGTVQIIIKEEAASMQKIILRLPLNIQELQRVYILKR